MYYNPYIVIPFVTWVIAQTLKFLLAAFRGRLDFQYLYASGGMPSVHSAVVCSLAVTALIVDGPQSNIFGFTLIFAAIVMYDSFGVRRSSGEQAAAINMLIASLQGDKVRLSNPHLKLREILGHKPLEVTAGAVLGIFLALLFNVSHLSSQLAWLQVIPTKFELGFYLILPAVLLLAGVIARVIIVWRWPRSLALGRLARDLLLFTQTIGWLGILVALAQYERASFLGWRVWSLIILAAAVIWGIQLAWYHRLALPAALAEEKNIERKRRWWPTRKKKR